MKKNSAKAQVFVIMAAVLWGTTGSAQKFAPHEASSAVIGALRMAIGGTMLFFIAALRGSLKSVSSMDKRLLLAASACMAIYQPLFFSGVSRTGIAFGTVIALGSAPIFSGIIECLSGGRVGRRWIAATSVSIAGCCLLFAGQNSLQVDLFGSLLSAGAGLSYALYARVSQKLFGESPRDAVNGVVFLLSGIMLSPILFLNDLSWMASTRGVLSVLHLGLVATALAYTIFARGLVHIPAPKAVTLSLFEPLTASMLGVAVFRETLSVVSIAGVALLFAGLIVNSLSTEKDTGIQPGRAANIGEVEA